MDEKNVVEIPLTEAVELVKKQDEEIDDFIRHVSTPRRERDIAIMGGGSAARGALNSILASMMLVNLHDSHSFKHPGGIDPRTIRKQEARKCHLEECKKFTDHPGGFCSGEHSREYKRRERELRNA